mmetsp:Transcript_25582/g.59414  ORF Transcript_25582/g.59414 Transcript_25582/m.59414 type:complete len:265 (+) Transcript_25582:966-1760(+)
MYAILHCGMPERSQGAEVRLNLLGLHDLGAGIQDLLNIFWSVAPLLELLSCLVAAAQALEGLLTSARPAHLCEVLSLGAGLKAQATDLKSPRGCALRSWEVARDLQSRFALLILRASKEESLQLGRAAEIQVCELLAHQLTVKQADGLKGLSDGARFLFQVLRRFGFQLNQTRGIHGNASLFHLRQAFRELKEVLLKEVPHIASCLSLHRAGSSRQGAKARLPLLGIDGEDPFPEVSQLLRHVVVQQKLVNRWLVDFRLPLPPL